MSDAWDPGQYERFKAERSQPFFDLLGLVEPVPGGRAVDLGCGTGELTRSLHERAGVATTLGIDSSAEMLAKSRAFAGGGLTFAEADIATFAPEHPFDIVFSNAALQWLPEHERLIPAVAALVARGGQLAVQMPANFDHPSHTIAAALADEEPYRTALRGERRYVNVRPPEWYAELLHGLGFARQHVRLQVYGHVLPGPEDVVEWVRGSLLTEFRERLTGELYAAFEGEYRRRLLETLPHRRPYLYPFKRLLFWGRKPLTPG